MVQIQQWVAQLGENDAAVRESAQHHLIRLKDPAVVRELVNALIDPNVHVRWEAAKALQSLADPVAAPALVHTLEDDNEDVRWVAAQGLIALGTTGVLHVLSGLIRRASSLEFCKAAHHVLHESKEGSPQIAAVQAALENMDRAVTAPQAAYQALVALNDTHIAG